MHIVTAVCAKYSPPLDSVGHTRTMTTEHEAKHKAVEGTAGWLLMNEPAPQDVDLYDTLRHYSRVFRDEADIIEGYAERQGPRRIDTQKWVEVSEGLLTCSNMITNHQYDGPLLRYAIFRYFGRMFEEKANTMAPSQKRIELARARNLAKVENADVSDTNSNLISRLRQLHDMLLFCATMLVVWRAFHAT